MINYKIIEYIQELFNVSSFLQYYFVKEKQQIKQYKHLNINQSFVFIYYY